MKLGDIAELKAGKHSSRITKKLSLKANDKKNYFFNEEYLKGDIKVRPPKLLNYNLNDFIITKKGDLIFSLLSGRSIIIDNNRSGLFVNQNYILINPKINFADKKYLCYMLNENANVRRQINNSNQSQYVKNYNLTLLRDVRIFLVNLKKQKKIGNLYLESVRRLKYSNDLSNNFFKYTMAVIDKNVN